MRELAVADSRAVDRAALALSMGGRALDPNGDLVPDPELAKLLFKESVVWVARSLSSDAPAEGLSYHDALGFLDERGVLERAFGKGGSAKGTLEALDAPITNGDDVRSAEISVMKLVEHARGRRTTLRHQKIARYGVLSLLLLSVAIVGGYVWTHPWRRYPFHASSAYIGFKQAGSLGDAPARGLLFHTNEEDAPWVEIDLLVPREIHSVVLKNRQDCCAWRGVPLVVEVTTDRTHWDIVAQRDEQFDTWRADFPPVEARYARIRSLKRTVLHLHEIQVR
jgi:hypothetical protein